MKPVVLAEPPLFRAALVGDLIREPRLVPEKYFARMMMPVAHGHILSQPYRFRPRLLTRSSSDFFVSAADITSPRNLVHRGIPFVIGVGSFGVPHIKNPVPAVATSSLHKHFDGINQVDR